jgi:hypothetical protein
MNTKLYCLHGCTLRYKPGSEWGSIPDGDIGINTYLVGSERKRYSETVGHINTG